MRHARVRLAAAMILAVMLQAGPGWQAAAAQGDTDLPAGHFFTQTGTGAGADYGYRITNEGGIAFWSEFQRLGGSAVLGYPVSRRFMLDGYVSQAMQKAILQWRPDMDPPQAALVNVFDELHDLGQDSLLQARYQVPPSFDAALFDAGKTPEQVRADRLALLNADPPLAAAYRSAGDLAAAYYGLPTSVVTNEGPFLAVRTQRTVFQHWLVANPAAGLDRGAVTAVNAGDIAKALGLVPPEATVPETIAGQPAPVPAAPPAAAQPGAAPGPSPAPPALQYRSKDVTAPPVDCSPDPTRSSIPCLSEVGNLSSQFIKGRVMDERGNHLQWVTVQADIAGAITSQQTEGDGTFNFTIAQNCPGNPITAHVVVLDNAGRVASDVRTVTYTGNCSFSGEFHFDFVRTG